MTDGNRTLILVDAYSQIYRGFYAIPGLRNSKGMPTNAVFSMAKLMNSIEKELAPEYASFAFDLGRTQFRLDIIPEYKANRPPMPEDLKVQLPVIREWIEASGWNIIEREGWEADDVISSIANKLKDFQIRIISPDKDIAQIVDTRVKMLVPDRKDSGFSVLDREGVIAKFAVPPENIIDYLAMTGDSSDNIRGVDGIGPKNAAKLISTAGGIESMLEHPERIENPRIREKILASAEILRKNLRVIALKVEIPDSSLENPEIFRKKAPDFDKLEKLANDLEMKSIAKEIAEKRKNFGKDQKAAEKFFTPDLF